MDTAEPAVDAVRAHMVLGAGQHRASESGQVITLPFVDGDQRPATLCEPLKVTTKRGVAHKDAFFQFLIG
jgi:hypothetical protein